MASILTLCYWRCGAPVSQVQRDSSNPGKWIEVTHTSYTSLDLCRDSTCTTNVIWFYISPGSGVFIDVSNTLQFDELHILSEGGNMETPHRVSESMVRLKNNYSALRNALRLTSNDVNDLRGIVRWNHNEFTFPTYRHEVMLFTNNLYDETSHLSEFVNEAWLRCDSGSCSTNDVRRAECNNIITGSMCPQYERIRIAFLGDSLTRGNALHEVTRRGPVHVDGRGNFPLRIQGVANFWNVTNFGHGGTTVQRECGSTAGAYADTATFRSAMMWGADKYLIMLGTNDALSCWNSHIFFHNLMTMVYAALAVSSMGVYIIVPPPILRDANKSSLIRREMAPAIQNVVHHVHADSKYVRMIDLRRECIDSHGNSCFRQNAFTEDGVHLNPMGSDQIADTIFRHLQS